MCIAHVCGRRCIKPYDRDFNLGKHPKGADSISCIPLTKSVTTRLQLGGIGKSRDRLDKLLKPVVSEVAEYEKRIQES